MTLCMQNLLYMQQVSNLPAALVPHPTFVLCPSGLAKPPEVSTACAPLPSPRHLQLPNFPEATML